MRVQRLRVQLATVCKFLSAPVEQTRNWSSALPSRGRGPIFVVGLPMHKIVDTVGARCRPRRHGGALCGNRARRLLGPTRIAWSAAAGAGEGALLGHE